MKHLNKKEGEQRVLFKAIQPNVLSKEPLTLSHPSKEPNILLKEPWKGALYSVNRTLSQETYMHHPSKKPYMFPTSPIFYLLPCMYYLSKEPYMFSKEPYICTCTRASFSSFPIKGALCSINDWALFLSAEPYIFQVETYFPTPASINFSSFPSKSPVFYVMSTIMYQKSPTYFREPMSLPPPELASPLSLSKDLYVLSNELCYLSPEPYTFPKKLYILTSACRAASTSFSSLWIKRALYSI